MYKNTYIHNALVSENHFLRKPFTTQALPVYDEIKDKLPQPYWQGHEAVIACYWKSWELAFSHLKRPTPDNGFVENYIDTAYNGNIFMWDSTFMTLFGLYGRRCFDFQKTLDNFYAKQHADGFICREISAQTGQDLFHRFDPVSTGPNIMLMSEWQYYRQTGDVKRLESIYPVMVAYHQWLKHYRSWPNGLYFASGWATGMDNQPRLPADYHPNFSHGHMIWLDTNLQQVLSGRLLFAIGEVLERWQEIEPIIDETAYLSDYINDHLYSDKTGFYHDADRHGRLNEEVLSIGAYWGLLADVYPTDRKGRLYDYLKDEKTFNRPHRIPSLNASHAKYQPLGRYWQGGVWAPTNYMVLKGLEQNNEHKLAFDIALNHLQNVTEVFIETGTLWENYAPEAIIAAKPAKPDFVGWTGLASINNLFEFVFGLKPQADQNKLIWHIQLEGEDFGVKNYPFGSDNRIDLHCDNRTGVPTLTITAEKPVDIEIHYQGGSYVRSADIAR
ncbi:MAG: MGH1-like glycoside hydrolase domain-containing protein [Francisellaceae bacterium]